MEKTTRKEVSTEVLSLEESRLISSSIHFQELVDSINQAGSEIASNFFAIGEALSTIELNEYYKISGFDDVYSFAEKVFGFRQTSVKNYIAVYERFNGKKSDFDKDKYSFTQLVELLPVADADLKDYKPEMKIKEIRSKKTINSFSNAKKSALKLMTEVLPSFIISIYPEAEFVSTFSPAKKGSYSETNDKIIFTSKYQEKYLSYFLKIEYDPNEDGLFSIDAACGGFYDVRFNVLDDLKKIFSKEPENTGSSRYQKLKDYIDRKIQSYNENEKTKEDKKAAVSLQEKEERRLKREKMTLKNMDVRKTYLNDINNWSEFHSCLESSVSLRKLKVDYSRLSLSSGEVLINISLPRTYLSDSIKNNEWLGEYYYIYSESEHTLVSTTYQSIIDLLTKDFY